MSDFPTPVRIEIWSVEWPEIVAGTDLAALATGTVHLRDGDIVVLSSKVVSKSEGQTSMRDRTEVVSADTRRVVARRGGTVIAETSHGLVMAAAGVDASNVPGGAVLSLPVDPDASAHRLRAAIHRRAGVNVGVVISDTAGRAWRHGQTDMAVGCAGLPALVDLYGSLDTEGNVLAVTAPALSDEVAAAADLVKGKVSRRPLAVVRGLGSWVLPVGDDGAGAVALVRPAAGDLFALGSREAVAAAVHRDDPVALDHFPRLAPGDPDPFGGLASARADVVVNIVTLGDPAAPVGWQVTVEVVGSDPLAFQESGRLAERVDALAAAYGLVPDMTRPGHGGVTDRVGMVSWHLTRA